MLKKGALASSALLVGLSSTGAVAAQDDGSNEQNTGGDGLMYTDEYHSQAQFRITSPVIEENPDVGGVSDLWADYNTRMIEYLNTNEQMYFFPAEDADVSEGDVYEFGESFTLFDPGEFIETDFMPIDEESEEYYPYGGDYDTVDGGGQALVRFQNANTSALLQITSEVVEWSPREDVQGTDIFTDYNTRHATYLNTNDQFTIYPSQDADIQVDTVYEVSDQFEITDAEGNLVTVDLEEVDDDEVDELM